VSILKRSLCILKWQYCRAGISLSSKLLFIMNVTDPKIKQVDGFMCKYSLIPRVIIIMLVICLKFKF